MPYSLSFAPEFFLSDDSNEIAVNSRPFSVYQAIVSIKAEMWRQLARDMFATDPDHLLPEAVLDRVMETDTCSNLVSPVEVWIDREGEYRFVVYEHEP